MEKSLSSKHEVLSEFSKLTSSSISCSCLIKFFFKSSKKIFCVLYENVQGIWKARLTCIFESVKKSWPYDTPIKLYVRKSEKSLDCEKWRSKSAWKILTKPHVLSWDFFSNATRKFSVDFMNTFNVSGRSAQLWSLRRWKNRDYTTCPSDYIANLAIWVFCGNIGSLLKKATVCRNLVPSGEMLPVRYDLQ